MLGKSAGRAALAIVLALGLPIFVATCSKMVPQDKATGEDGRSKGARAISLRADGATKMVGRSKGVVTYPGGDRVDWKVIELPKDKAGTLEVRLSWIAPRPGLALGLDVFDQYGQLVSAEPRGKRRRAKSRRAEISPAKGKYFVRVYAKGRGDAGAYTVRVAWSEKILAAGGEIPDPPRLPAVPEAEVPCDETSFDKKNPLCKDVCPMPPDPNWPPCKRVCPNLPIGDANLPACWPVMDCPAQPDRRVKKCFDRFPACNPQALDPNNPKCDNFKAPPVKGRIVNVQKAADGVIITVNRGKDKMVDKGWKGKILRKDSDRPLEGGDFTVSKVGNREAVGKVKGLTSDQVSANPDVILEAP